MNNSQFVEHKHVLGVSIAAEPLPPLSFFIILCFMYIPNPAKLLFQYDDGWNRFIDNNFVNELSCFSKTGLFNNGI